MTAAQIPQAAFPSVSWLAIAPELVLSVGAALVLLVDVQWRPRLRVLGWLAVAILATAVGTTFAQWNRVEDLFPFQAGTSADLLPFAGMIVFDHTSVLAAFVMLSVTSLGLAGAWRLLGGLGRRAAEALALVFLSAAGFMLMAASGHLMMMFLGLEVGSISLYVLAGITRERARSDEAAIKYFLLGSVASAVFVYGVALVFAGTGELNLLGVQIFLQSQALLRPAVLLIGVTLIIVGLGFKVSAAPFHAWAPDVYQGAPAGLVGYMAAAAKVGGFAALTRVLFTSFPSLAADWGPIVAGVATLSMVVGSVVAIVQDDVRRLLAYSGVAHAGFILMGVVAGGVGWAAVWFYLAVYTVQLVGAFGVVAASGGSSVASLAGLARRSPGMAAMFSVFLLGMAGLPLTSGFVAKFGVFQEAWRSGYPWLVIVAVLASVVAFFLYLRVIVIMYMHDPEGEEAPRPLVVTRWALAVAAVFTIVFGVVPAPLLDLAGNAIPQ